MPERDPRAPTVYELDRGVAGLDRRLTGLESEMDSRFARARTDTEGRLLKLESGLDTRLGRIENKLDLVITDRERLARVEVEVRSYGKQTEDLKLQLREERKLRWSTWVSVALAVLAVIAAWARDIS